MEVLVGADALLRSAGLGKTYESFGVIFSQGAPSESVLYLQEGVVKLSVSSPNGKEAVLAILTPGDFFGESALTGQPRMETATAMTTSRVLVIPKEQMTRWLRTERAFTDRFIVHMLTRKSRGEEELVDQLCNTCEQRLARMLLRLAHDGEAGGRRRVPSIISQSMLADMIGTTRPRVNLLLRRFKARGFIEGRGRGSIEINDSLVSVINDDNPTAASRDGEPYMRAGEVSQDLTAANTASTDPSNTSDPGSGTGAIGI